MRHLFGYPVSMWLQVEDTLLDVSNALKITNNATGVEVDIEKLLDLVHAYETQSL